MSKNYDGIEFRYEDSDDSFIIPATLINHAEIFNIVKNIDISGYGEVRDMYDVGRLVVKIRNVSEDAIREHFKKKIAYFRIMGKSGYYRFKTFLTKDDMEILPIVVIKELKDENLVKLAIYSQNLIG